MSARGPIPVPSRRLAAAASLLPGALLGAHLAGLLFFLNPEIPFGGVLVGRGIAAYAPLGALGAAALYLPWTLRRPLRVVRSLPWALSGVLLLASLFDGYHASLFAFYLPTGINVRLVKAAVLLGLASVIAFYTALLHSLHGRSYGLRSRVGLWLLAAASLYVTVERREAYRPSPRVTPASAVEQRRPPRLLLVGLEGATLDVILPLAEQGELPFLSGLLAEGSYGRLRSLGPPRREPAWITLATGKYPYKHGITDSSRYPFPVLAGRELSLLPAGLGFGRWGTFRAQPRPADRRDRKASTLWEIAARIGVGAGAVGWPTVMPSPPDVQFALSESFFQGETAAAQVFPAELAIQARLFRVETADLDPDRVAELAPEHRASVMAAMGQDRWRTSLAEFLRDSHPGAPILAVRLPGLAAVSRRTFGGYVAHRFEGLGRPRYERASRTLVAYYRSVDGLLARLAADLDPEDLFVVVSAYGYEAPGWWHRLVRWGRPVAGRVSVDADGVLLLRGGGVRRGERLNQAALEDVLPTLLYALGWPQARDFDGHVLTAAFTPQHLARQPLTFLPSYETLEPASEPPRGLNVGGSP